MMKFNEKYNSEDFLQFLDSFLPKDFQQKEKDIILERDKFKKITNIKELGFCESLDLYILEIDHNSEADPRIAIVTEAFRILAQYWAHKALVIFKNKDSDNYRLSYLTISLDLNDKNRPVKKYSNAHRYSFYLGTNAKIRTPEQQLIKKGRIIDLSDLHDRFSIEVVNKEFYKEISEHFTQLVGGSLYKGKKKQDYKGLLKLPFIQDKNQTSLEFAVRLIGRVIFCWFLREKKSDQGKSLMPNDLLSLQAVKKTPDYYHKILEPIFFEVLNKPVKSRKEDYSSEPFSSIPYLNGGLFTPHDDDYYKRTNGDLQSQFHNILVIPDEWLIKFFELLETYNFTIDENTSFDEELSIDPEMLGRIFENLLAEINPETGESARKSTGSYYTPRVIVDYMVDESLLLYLKEQTGISEEKLKAIISYDLNDDLVSLLTVEEKENIIDALEKIKILDPACGSGAFPMGVLQKIVFILQQVDPEGQLWFKKQIKNTSPEIKKVIEREFIHKNFDYIRKLGIIRENIYGVDIQPIATEISRLRCFLTLVVDERIQEDLENRGIEPLPNLDFKFVTANTLIGLPGSQAVSQIDLFEDDAGIKELKDLRDLFFNASGSERDQLKLQFVQAQNRMFQRLINEGRKGHADLTTKLSTWDPFSHNRSLWFDPEWMFGIKDGFDIVIANPPYVGQKGNNELFKPIKESPLEEFHQRRMDLFYFFFHLALNIGKPNSVISFITTNYYLTATYADKLRKDFKKRSVVKHLINFNELKIFESALGQHNMITILQKIYDQNITVKTCMTQRSGLANSEILRKIMNGTDEKSDYYSVEQKDLYDGNEYYIRLQGSSSTSSSNLHRTLDKLKRQGESLSIVCNITTGIQTGVDKVTDKNIQKYGIQAQAGEGIFVLTDNEVNNFNLGRKSKETLKPWFKNSDIFKWGTEKSSVEKLIYYTNKLLNDLDPTLVKHFERYRKILINRNARSGTGIISENDYDNFINGKKYISYVMIASSLKAGKYYCISYARDQEVFEGEKIVAPQRSSDNTFGYNDIPWYASADVYFITKKDNNISLKYVLALLNSKLYYLWLYHRGKRKGETLELYQKPLSEIPIKEISTDEQIPFVEIVDKILTITKDENYLQNSTKQAQVQEYENQIDQLVYKLYSLTPEEIAIVEENNQ